MIVLDTNVISELARTEPEKTVLDWVDAQQAGDLYLTAITVGELSFGLARLPAGRRQRELAARVNHLIEQVFADRVLPYGAHAARLFGVLTADRERQGRPIAMADGQIAAVCLQHGTRLATRNTSDFAATVPDLIDPWSG